MSPRARSSHWLADRFDVTERTIRRDVDSLQQTGVPIYALPGRNGGYVVDKTHTLPPVNITAQEAVAAAVALSSLGGTPFVSAARSALCKLLAVMAKREVDAARDLADRIHLAKDAGQSSQPKPEVLRIVEDSVIRRRVLIIDYADRNGELTTRTIEPLGLLSAGNQWYLIGWCRLRAGVRDFRLDRVLRATATVEVAPERTIDLASVSWVDAPIFRFDFLENADRMGS